MLDFLRCHTSWLALTGLLSLSTLGHAAESAPDALRIGYQKGSVRENPLKKDRVFLVKNPFPPMMGQ